VVADSSPVVTVVLMLSSSEEHLCGEMTRLCLASLLVEAVPRNVHRTGSIRKITRTRFARFLRLIDRIFILINMQTRRSKPRSKIGKVLAFLLSLNVQRGDVAKAARSFAVNYNTLKSAWLKLTKFKQDHPLDTNDRAILYVLHIREARGAHSNRLFTDEQEQAIVNKLRSDFKRGFTNHNIVETCRSLFRDTRNQPRKYSKVFIKRFKSRWNIRSSNVRVYQQTKEVNPSKEENDIESAIRFMDTIDRLRNRYSADRFINVDECPSYVRNLPTKALHFTDQPPPYVVAHAKPRDCVTVIGAVIGNGRVLGTTVVAKGTTSRCEQQFRSKLPNTFVQHTESGLTTSESFIQYLQHVILPYTKDEPAVLIVDAYPAHITNEVKQFCKSHHLKQVVVPDRATAYLQPLDVAVFGSAKWKIHTDVKNTMFQSDFHEADRWQATAECVKAINSISRANGKRAWIDTFPFWSEVLEGHKSQ
jgi:hypothetical protein